MKYEAIRKTVLEAILEAVEKGLINGTSGNIAMRDSEDRNIVAITPSGISYTGMKPEDIAIVERKAPTNHDNTKQAKPYFISDNNRRIKIGKSNQT